MHSKTQTRDFITRVRYDVVLLADLRALMECRDEVQPPEEEYCAQREALHLGAEPRRGEI